MTLDEYFGDHADSKLLFDGLHSLIDTLGETTCRATTSQVAFRRKKLYLGLDAGQVPARQRCPAGVVGLAARPPLFAALEKKSSIRPRSLHAPSRTVFARRFGQTGGRLATLRLGKRRLNLPPPSLFRKPCYKSGSCQSMGGSPSACRAALVLEKWRQPKNPRVADSGEGCGAFSTVWRVVSMPSALRWA